MSESGVVSQAPYGLMLRNSADPRSSYGAKGIQRSVRLLPGDWEQVRRAAATEGLTLAEWIRGAIFSKLPNHCAEPAPPTPKSRSHAPAENRHKATHTNDRADLTKRANASTGHGKALTEPRR